MPLAIVGVFGVRRPWALALVIAFLLLNAVFYSLYANTALHPRFLYASLPELFVLWAAGVAVIVAAGARGRVREPPMTAPAATAAPVSELRRWALPSIAIAGAAIGAGLRLWGLLSPQGALDADEAVVGLMARGILHGRLPVFFPGQGYGGSQEAFLAAPLVAIFGLNAAAIRAVPILLWLVAAVLVWRIGRRVLDERRGVLAAVLFWIWPTYFAWKSTRAHGFYGSELVLGLIIVLEVLRLRDNPRDATSSGSGWHSAAASGRARRSRSSPSR